MNKNPKHENYLMSGWLVILLALIYGGALAGVHTGLSGRIAENRRNETYSVIPMLAPGADRAHIVEHVLDLEDGSQARVYQARDESDVTVGWVVPAMGLGFADRIEVLIGLDLDVDVITGLYVLDQKETPGLGDYITGQPFLGQFSGKPVSQPFVAVKTEAVAVYEIQALTGATISSDTICDIVNRAVRNLRGPILDQLRPQDET